MVALGALFLLILTDAMDLLTIDPRIQTIFLGVIVVLAVALDELSHAEDGACLTSTSRCAHEKREPRGSVAKPAGGSAADPDRGDGAWRSILSSRASCRSATCATS